MKTKVQDHDNRSQRSFEEDFKYENGNYMNLCQNCFKTFIGYKRRVICKLCIKK